MEHFCIRKIRIDIIIPLLQHNSVTSDSFILQMVNVLTICMSLHCLNNFVVSRILPQQALIIAGNNNPLVCDNNRSIFLDTEGKTDCEYSTDESLTDEITEYLQKDIIMDFTGYEERTYSERFDREDGSHVDIAACARKNAPGIVESTITLLLNLPETIH